MDSHQIRDYRAVLDPVVRWAGMAKPPPNRSTDAQTLVRHMAAEKERWELARRAAEARRYPKGESTLPMQAWITEVLNSAADDELGRGKKR